MISLYCQVLAPMLPFSRFRAIPPVLKEAVMLRWALVFLIVALIAAFLGFGGIAGVSMDIGKILFFVFLVLFVISLSGGAFAGRGTRH